MPGADGARHVVRGRGRAGDEERRRRARGEQVGDVARGGALFAGAGGASVKDGRSASKLLLLVLLFSSSVG